MGTPCVHHRRTSPLPSFPLSRAANTVSKTVHGLPDGRGDYAAGGRLRPILDDGAVRRLSAEDQRLPQVI